MGVPLTAEDRAILALEGPTIAGHTCKVIRTASGSLSAADLAAAIAGRLRHAPRLTWRLGGPAEAPEWLPAELDVESHVGAVRTVGPVDDQALRTEVVRLFEQRLDRSRPLWRMDVVGPLAGGGTAIVWRVHHALADGATVMRIARDVLWDAGPDRPARRVAVAPEQPAAGRSLHLAGLAVRELVPARRSSPFDARIGTGRAAAFASTSLPGLHDAARSLAGATVNDAVLAVLAGALRQWLEHRHGPVRDLRVKIPVSLHHDGRAEGNRDSFFCVSLPVSEPDAVRRLDAVRAETALRKTHHDAVELAELLDRLATAPPGLRRGVQRLLASPRTFAVNVSNVPGPHTEVSVLGARVAAIHSIAEVAQRHALRVAVVSVADRLCFGFLADRAAVEELDVLAAAVEQEAAELVGRHAAGLPSRRQAGTRPGA